MTPSPLSTRKILLLFVGAGLAVSLAACGGSSSGNASGTTTTSTTTTSSSASTGGHGMGMGSATYPPVTPGPAAAGAHNDADVAFADGMIPHHGQGVVMADMVIAGGDDAKVKALAEQIKKAQTPEIATMTGWLKGWGAPAPDPYSHAGGMPGMSHGGMMSAEQMQQLMTAHGRDADAMFLTHMIQHHRGAIDMAKTELKDGSNPDAKALAQKIVADQTTEIATMEQLLSSLR